VYNYDQSDNGGGVTAMSTQRVADMTLDELKTLVEELVDQRLELKAKSRSTRSVEEIHESIRRNRWTPPPGSPSSLDLLRGDRDR
jgi:hypothetical protein